MLIPFIELWYGDQTEFVWRDNVGIQHIIHQGDGGEQGDALMPALFCTTLKPALVEIQSRLRGTDIVVGYLDDVYVVCDRENARYSYDVCVSVLRNFCTQHPSEFR